MVAISDARAVQLFREILQFQTTASGNVTGANEACFAFLKQLCEEIGLTTKRIEGGSPQKPILLATWTGTETGKGSVLLNSHYDVVPVVTEKWTKPAWEGLLTDDGKIYGRGAQDMKSVCIQYLVAVSRLIAAGYKPTKTVHLSYVPDEEVGGTEGMAHFITTDDFKELDVKCALDEGLCNPAKDTFTVFYGERIPYAVEVTACGPTGHGSRFIEATATNCLTSWATKALEFRRKMEAELHGEDTHGCGHAKCKKLGDVTTMNLTIMKAGVSTDGGKTFAVNVIPTEAMMGFDCRIPVSTPFLEIKDMFTRWCRESEKENNAPEGSITFRALRHPQLEEHYTTDLSEENPYWVAFDGAVKSCGYTIEKEVFPAATDSRFLRALKIPALGFSPITSDPILLHEHDEYLSKDIFVKGCGVYEHVIKAVSSV
eukprot:TRINITY_DN13874_c2_g1_i1.p1 TRINITY_DN13874_c2_g1~~TRINITY_DN13874_c2_g1_i1.p1  ORF type:complete len:429 (+),score=89.28 TRINITY_DN13874_c2_g1_i1:80-1366(+)